VSGEGVVTGHCRPEKSDFHQARKRTKTSLKIEKKCKKPQIFASKNSMSQMARGGVFNGVQVRSGVSNVSIF
jgi:hypothetical protein